MLRNFNRFSTKMILNILFVIIGIALVLWGADRMTDGAVALAERMNISQIVIGLTVVAMGTSAPELFVSLVSAIKGTPDLAVGNVVGSNIFNTMLIVGCAAIAAPLAILKTTVKRDLPFIFLISVIFIAMCTDMQITRKDALILSGLFLLYLAYTLIKSRKAQAAEELKKKGYSPIKASCFVALGLACLILGSNLFVNGATSIASLLGVSEAVIGLTVVAGGTSLPELATSIVAARKGQSAIAIGNVIGSNVFNILMILGVTGLICPMQIQGITTIDLFVMTISALLLWLFAFTKLKVERWEGAILVLLFLIYMYWLISGAI